MDVLEELIRGAVPALIAALAALGGVKLTQKAQEKQLGERLDHERQVRRHEELMNAARNADSLLRELGLMQELVTGSVSCSGR